MKTIVYLTLNKKNNKIYVGVHTTETPDRFDGYLGCGVYRNMPSSYKKSKTAFQYAVNKYGPDEFVRTTLAVFDDVEDAYELEARIVTSEFIKRKDVYNMIVGGKHTGGISKIVYQYDYNWKLVAKYSSRQDASLITNTTPTAIESAIKGKTTSSGFFWTDVPCENINKSEYKTFVKNPKVYQYDSEGNYIREFESATILVKIFKLSRPTFNRAIQGKYKVKGFYYSLEKMDKFDIPKTISIRDKKVYLYDLDGNFYKEFESPIECARFFGQKSSSAISSAVRLNRAYKGYQISFEKVPFMKKISLNNQKQKVLQYDMEGKLIKVWDSITAAVEVHGQGVKKVIRGLNKHCHNFIFKLES